MFARSNSDQNAGGVPPAKRALFSKPSWSKAESLKSANLFNRSDQAYVKSKYELEREKKKLAKELRQKNRHGGGEERSAKRQRMSDDEISEEQNDDDDDDDEDDDDDDDEDEDDGSQDHDHRDKVGSHDSDEKWVEGQKLQKSAGPGLGVEGGRTTTSIQGTTQALHMTPSERISSLVSNYQEKILARSLQEQAESKEKKPNIIDLDEDEEHDAPTERASEEVAEVVEVVKPSAESDMLDPDEEFPELARRARERARSRQLEQDAASQPTVRSPPGRPDTFLNQSSTKYQPSPSPQAPEPIVRILITSSIPETRPLLVARKLSQRLKDVRLAWVQKQELDIPADDIFLTWRGKRLFDVTTCKSLGLDLNADGSLVEGGLVESGEAHVQVEAMTAAIFAKCKKAKRDGVSERDAAEANGDYDSPAAEGPQGQEQEQQPDERLRIICKAKGYPEFKLIVKRTTLIAKILSAFRSQNHIEPEREAFLQFDGDRLEPHCEVGSTEISDLDHLDVYIK